MIEARPAILRPETETAMEPRDMMRYAETATPGLLGPDSLSRAAWMAENRPLIPGSLRPIIRRSSGK